MVKVMTPKDTVMSVAMVTATAVHTLVLDIRTNKHRKVQSQSDKLETSDYKCSTINTV